MHVVFANTVTVTLCCSNEAPQAMRAKQATQATRRRLPPPHQKKRTTRRRARSRRNPRTTQTGQDQANTDLDNRTEATKNQSNTSAALEGTMQSSAEYEDQRPSSTQPRVRKYRKDAHANAKLRSPESNSEERRRLPPPRREEEPRAREEHDRGTWRNQVLPNQQPPQQQRTKETPPRRWEVNAIRRKGIPRPPKSSLLRMVIGWTSRLPALNR